MRRRLLFLILLAAWWLTAFAASAQEERKLPAPRRPSAPAMMDLRRRLVELDRLLTLGSVGRAESLLEELSMHSALERELMTRRIRLAQMRDRHEEAADLARGALDTQPLNSGLWRSLTSSLLASDKPDSARLAADRFIATSPNRRSAGMVTVELFHDAGRATMAAGLIDSLRQVLDDPLFLARQKAVSLLAMDHQSEAADEVVADLRHNPYNLALVRTEILDGDYRPGEAEDFLDRLRTRAREPQRKVVEVLLLANLKLLEGRSAEAVELVRPLMDARSNMNTTLQNAVTLSRELPLLAEAGDHALEMEASTEYLLEVLGYLAGEGNYDLGIRKRAADHLAAVCETALEHRLLGDDPEAAAERFGDLLALVRKAHPASEHLYSSQIKLATYMRDELGRPRAAARRLEGMLLDLDLPLPGVALVRLTLGECYLAAGDTTRGRLVLTRLGRDPEFRQAGGHAHYHLARLDLAQGNLATARDRFAVVALENPAAPYANDALELGLAITEEMDNPSGGPEFMFLYSQAVYFDLVAKPAERLEALQSFIGEGLRRLDLEEPQHLLERARFELAVGLAETGRIEEAIGVCKTIVSDHPDGRFPAEALMLQSGLEREGGQEEAAKVALQQLLAQYPDYLFIDDARDVLRSLP